MNLLSHAASDYLLQHADDPVDWRPWGEDAFREARERDVPVLVSIGYAACHWCHVMQRESFRDDATATLMNERFVNVKIDREEHPDVDAVYMAALQAMRGQGGWPLTAITDHDGRPFFTGTYFPPDDRPGMPSFQRVLDAVHDAWTERRDALLEDAEKLEAHLRGSMAAPAGRLDPLPADAALPDPAGDALANLAPRVDERHGGFGDAPKFPPHPLLRWLHLRHEPEAHGMADATLRAIARGGISDPIAGGVARYAVDEAWAVPHFEKMLYDNAQLLPRFVEAHQRTGDRVFFGAASGIAAWMEAELRLPSGLFATALDADSTNEQGVKEEGAFYAWTASAFDAAIRDALGEAEVPFARAAYGVQQVGPFEGANVLRVAATAEALAAQFDVPLPLAEQRLDAIRMVLHAARSARARPARDEKAILGLQGLAIHGLARAGRLLPEPRLVTLAQEAAHASLATFQQPDGTWMRRARGDVVGIPALLEDHAFFGLGLLELHRADGDPRWLDAARGQAERIVKDFVSEGGGFQSVARSASSPIDLTPRSVVDGPQPADTIAAAELVWRMARLDGNTELEALARGAVAPLATAAGRHPQALASVLAVLDFMRAPPRELAITGPDDAGGADLWDVAASLPLDAWIVQRATEPGSGPLVEGRDMVEGRAAAWVCEGYACRLPITDVDELGGALLVA